MSMSFRTRFGNKAMARLLAAGLVVCGAGIATAQMPATNTQYNYNVNAQQDLQQTVAPLALYPDALLAQALVASTYPQDVLAAAQWLRQGGDVAIVVEQPWDISVKGLVHFPDALYLLADNEQWMNQLGATFMSQQAEVMAAVQRVRNRAWLNGYLASNRYQNVISEQGVIQVIPANPQVIYVPVYQPQMILLERPMYVEPAPCITFGLGIEVGAWLHHDCDWLDASVYVGNWGWDRPWWRGHDRNDWRHGDWLRDRDGRGYADNRPGRHPYNRYEPQRNGTNLSHVRNGNGGNTMNINKPGRWEHDARKPAPQMRTPAVSRPAAVPTRSVANTPPNAHRMVPAIPERLPVTNRQMAPQRPAVNNPPARRIQETAPIARPVHNTTVRPTATPAPVRQPTPTVRQTPSPAIPQRIAIKPTPFVRTPVVATSSARPVAQPVRQITPVAARRPAIATPDRPTRPMVTASRTVQPTRGTLPPAAKPAPQSTRTNAASTGTRLSALTDRPTPGGRDNMAPRTRAR